MCHFWTLKMIKKWHIFRHFWTSKMAPKMWFLSSRDPPKKKNVKKLSNFWQFLSNFWQFLSNFFFRRHFSTIFFTKNFVFFGTEHAFLFSEKLVKNLLYTVCTNCQKCVKKNVKIWPFLTPVHTPCFNSKNTYFCPNFWPCTHSVYFDNFLYFFVIFLSFFCQFIFFLKFFFSAIYRRKLGNFVVFFVVFFFRKIVKKLTKIWHFLSKRNPVFHPVYTSVSTSKMVFFDKFFTFFCPVQKNF